MNKSKQVRHVYEEMRSVIGAKFPAHTLLGSAAALVELYDDRVDEGFVSLQSPQRTFGEMPLDVAFSDGGWRVLLRESNWKRYDDETIQIPNYLKKYNL